MHADIDHRTKQNTEKWKALRQKSLDALNAPKIEPDGADEIELEPYGEDYVPYIFSYKNKHYAKRFFQPTAEEQQALTVPKLMKDFSTIIY